MGLKRLIPYLKPLWTLTFLWHSFSSRLQSLKARHSLLPPPLYRPVFSNFNQLAVTVLCWSTMAFISFLFKPQFACRHSSLHGVMYSIVRIVRRDALATGKVGHVLFFWQDTSWLIVLVDQWYWRPSEGYVFQGFIALSQQFSSFWQPFIPCWRWIFIWQHCLALFLSLIFLGQFLIGKKSVKIIEKPEVSLLSDINSVAETLRNQNNRSLIKRSLQWVWWNQPRTLGLRQPF